MNAYTTVILVAIVVIVLLISLVCCYRYIKKKIRNKIIDAGANIITNATEKYLDEETAGKVNDAAGVAAETLKGGKGAIVKKGLEMARDAVKKNNK